MHKVWKTWNIVGVEMDGKENSACQFSSANRGKNAWSMIAHTREAHNDFDAQQASYVLDGQNF